MKDYDENKELSYIQYWDVNNWYGWVMSQMLPVNNFDWIKDTYQFNEDFIKTSDEGWRILLRSWCSVSSKTTQTS